LLSYTEYCCQVTSTHQGCRLTATL